MATFAPMSSGSDSWAVSDEQPAPTQGRYRAHLPPAIPSARGRALSPPRGPVPARGMAALGQRAHELGMGIPGPSRRPAQQQQQQQTSASKGAWAWLVGSTTDAQQQQQQQQQQHRYPGAAEAANERSSLLSSSRQDFAAHQQRLGRGARGTASHRRDDSSSSSRGDVNAKLRWRDAFRPSKSTVEDWLNSWWKRWGVLAVAPALIVWFWCAMPFPKTDPYDPNPPWCDPNSPGPDAPWCGGDGPTVGPADLSTAALVKSTQRAAFQIFGHASSSAQTVDANFWFFLIFYYGIYCAVALIYITQLFSLYRLNWWPAALGAKTSYATFWLLSLCAGYVLHALSLDRLGAGWLDRWLPGWGSGGKHDTPPSHGHDDNDDIQWQRKTLWVGLAFATMAMPALVCLAGLRRSGRQTYRHSLTDTQKTFLERQLARRIPASYTRFLWFMTTIMLALVALLAGQGYASVYLSTLPHTGLDGTAYVMFWTVNVNVLMILSHWILEEKVRSRALLFVFKYYYFLVYFIFYRNLFARLNSFDQFALIQLLSSFWVCIWYPFSMTSFCHRIVQYFNPEPKSWEEYVESVGLAFYLRNLAQNTTMLAFLGWVSILHFGTNQHLYPFFAFDDKRDPYNYQLTMLGSLAIWGSELLSSFIARWLCLFYFSVDITNLGLDEMRDHPELVTSVVWTSVHVLQDCLLFLIKLNFR